MHLALAANAELAASSGPSLGSLLIDGSVRQLAQSGVGFLFFLQGLLQKLHGLGHAELFRPGDQRAVA